MPSSKETQKIYDSSEIRKQLRKEWRNSPNGREYQEREANRRKHFKSISDAASDFSNFMSCCSDTSCLECFGTGLKRRI